jgi:hypothetical protein
MSQPQCKAAFAAWLVWCDAVCLHVCAAWMFCGMRCMAVLWAYTSQQAGSLQFFCYTGAVLDVDASWVAERPACSARSAAHQSPITTPAKAQARPLPPRGRVATKLRIAGHNLQRRGRCIRRACQGAGSPAATSPGLRCNFNLPGRLACCNFPSVACNLQTCKVASCRPQLAAPGKLHLAGLPRQRAAMQRMSQNIQDAHTCKHTTSHRANQTAKGALH